MNRSERRARTYRKILHRKNLMKKMGLQGGTIYERHREKIKSSAGYMRSGNVSHYVAVRPTRKTRKRGCYGKVFTPSYRDFKRNQALSDQLEASLIPEGVNEDNDDI